MKKLAIDKQLCEDCAQLAINSYNGRWGDERNILDGQKIFYGELPHWYMGWKEGKLFIVFQGTVNKAGWENNLDYQQIKWTDKKFTGYVHKGFFRDEVMKAMPTILAEISEAAKERGDYDLVITGHSKGASNAILASAIIKSYNLAFIRSIKCVSFAPARVMSPLAKRVYKKLNIPTMVFQYGNDTVCKVPFRLSPGLIKRCIGFLWMNFWPTIQWWSHPVKVTHLGRAWYIWLMKTLPVIRHIGNPADHRPQNYLEGVKRLK